jgi:hypothetical protein
MWPYKKLLERCSTRSDIGAQCARRRSELAAATPE